MRNLGGGGLAICGFINLPSDSNSCSSLRATRLGLLWRILVSETTKNTILYQGSPGSTTQTSIKLNRDSMESVDFQYRQAWAGLPMNRLLTQPSRITRLSLRGLLWRAMLTSLDCRKDWGWHEKQDPEMLSHVANDAYVSGLRLCKSLLHNINVSTQFWIWSFYSFFLRKPLQLAAGLHRIPTHSWHIGQCLVHARGFVSVTSLGV